MISKKDKHEDLSDLSGEKNIKPAPKYILPSIQLNGNEGKFYKRIVGEEGIEKKAMTNKVQGVMLKIRRVCNAFTTDYILSTNEHNTWRDNVTVFKTILEDGKSKGTKMFDKGSSQIMKEKYGMKMTQIIYFLIGKEVIKLRIKGKGLGQLIEYWKVFKDKNEHVYNYVTEVKAFKAGKNPAGVDYYATNFQRLEKVGDMDVIAKEIREVAGKIQEIDDFYKNRVSEEEELSEGAKEMKKLGKDEIPTIEEDGQGGYDIKKDEKKEGDVKVKKEKTGDEEEINVEDIPF